MKNKLKLKDREWREFQFKDVFTRIQRGKRLKKDDHIEGTTPYVSSTATNNGIDGFVGNKERVRIFSNCISLANSGSVGSAFFQKFEFVASDHVTSLQKEGIDEYAYLFMLPIISRLSEKYSFNREISDLRISRERLMLPVQSDGTPDWAFMDAYMKQEEERLIEAAREKLENKLLEDIIVLGALKDREWKKFKIEDLFCVRIGKSLDGNKVNRVGQVAYITRKESDNGLDGFIDEDDSMLTNAYPVITIGNETAQPFVQVYPFFTGTKVNILIPKESIARDLYTLQFIAVSLAQHKCKYSYSYTINSSRLKEQVVLLPVQSDGTPDWEFMSAFMQRVEQETLGKALQFFKPRCEEM